MSVFIKFDAKKFYNLFKTYLVAMFFLIFFLVNALAGIDRKTTFDNRPICESNKGVWREYGNGCVDECFAKFDELAVCTYARTFGCDCGKGKCWDNDKCMAVIEYKKIFDEIKERDIESMSQAKRKRIAQAKKYQNDLVTRMITNRSALTVAKFNEKDQVVGHKNFSNNNYGEIYRQRFPQIAEGKQYVTETDERYSTPNIDTRRIKSIQYVEPVDPSKVNSDTQPTINEVNVNEAPPPRIIIEQQGMPNQIIEDNSAKDIDKIKKNPNQIIIKNVSPPVFAKEQKPAEVFEVPKDFLQNENSLQNQEQQLPIVEMPME